MLKDGGRHGKPRKGVRRAIELFHFQGKWKCGKIRNIISKLKK